MEDGPSRAAERVASLQQTVSKVVAARRLMCEQAAASTQEKEAAAERAAGAAALRARKSEPKPCRTGRSDVAQKADLHATDSFFAGEKKHLVQISSIVADRARCYADLQRQLPRAIREKIYHESKSGERPSFLVVARVRPLIAREQRKKERRCLLMMIIIGRG